MRIVVWNCNMALHRKLAALLQLRPDVAVIPECADVKAVRQKTPLLVPESALWAGRNPHKGLAVFEFGDYSVELDDSYHPENKIIAPVRVAGPVSFNLLAIWSDNDRNEAGRNKREGPVLRALKSSKEFCTEGPLVVAGDFNNHVRWDEAGKPNNQANIVAALESIGLVSAYHFDRNVGQGEEPEPTHYWRDRKKQGPTYHIDYIFLPRQWAENMREMTVGSFEDWCGSGLSDHVPLVVEVEPAALA